MDTKSQDSNYSGRIDSVKFILKVCIVIGMLLASIGISIFTYVMAYPAANVTIIPQSQIKLLHVSTWLIIAGMIIVFVFGSASQIASCMKRRYKESSAMASYKNRKDSGIGTGYNPVSSSATPPAMVDETTVWTRSPIGVSSHHSETDNEDESVALLAGVSPPVATAPFPKPQTKSLRINLSDSTASPV